MNPLTLAGASRHLRLLAQIERALARNDWHEVERLLAGVDPIEVDELAFELDGMARVGAVLPGAFGPGSLRADLIPTRASAREE